MVELKDTTLYRPAPSNVSEDAEFSNKRVVHCAGRQSAVTKDLFTERHGAFPDPGPLVPFTEGLAVAQSRFWQAG